MPARAPIPFYQSGAVADDVASTQNADTDMWMMRDCPFDTSGKQTNEFWEAADYSGNPLATKNTLNPQDPTF